MTNILRHIWHLCIIRPLILFALGVNIRNREGLYKAAPAIIVANHNSHLDTMVLTSLFPLRLLKKFRPVAADDYFLKNRWLAWFALNIIGIIPLQRQVRSGKSDPLAGCSKAIESGDILLLFPEGTRGEPERLAAFKSGVAHLAQRHPEVPVIPVFMQGLGKALPRGECILVPIVCDLVVGESIFWTGSRGEFMKQLEKRMQELARQVQRTILE
ncbi:MAG: lysophospholipid acyltransferase family protein [Syntrophotaleaceae bacterium]